MRIPVEILFLALTVTGSEILDKHESTNNSTTTENRQTENFKTDDTASAATKYVNTQATVKTIHSGMLDEALLKPENCQATNLIKNITQNLDYVTFLRRNLRNQFLVPHEMSYLQNVTLSLFYSLSKGHQNESKCIEDAYGLSQFQTMRMFYFLTRGFNFSDEEFASIFNNYIRYKKIGIFKNFNKGNIYYYPKMLKNSILIDSLHIFYVTEGRRKCTSDVCEFTETTNLSSTLPLNALLTKNIIFNEALNTSLNLINSSDVSDDNFQASVEDNLYHLEIVLKIIGQAPNGDNALHWASRKGFLEVVREILSTKSINVDSRNSARWTPLQLAAKEGHLSIVRELLDYNASVNSQNRNGDSALHWASWEGHVSVVDELLKRNAEVDIPNNYGNTPLSWAAWGGKIDVVRLLLRNGAKIELKNYDEGWNSLHRASEKGQLEVVREFLSIDPFLVNIVDNRYRTAYDVAKEYDHKDVADYIKSLMNEPESSGHSTKVQGSTSSKKTEVIDNKTVIKELPNRYMTELEKSAEEGNAHAVKYILKHFEDSYLQNENETSPLHVASKSGHVQVVKELLNYKIAVNAKDSKGWTPLHFAAKNGNLQIVKLLLEKNASLNEQTYNGDTALHWAAWENHMLIAKELVDKNAFINVQNKYGNTPLNWASWNNNIDVIKFLLDNNAKIHFRSYKEGWSSIHRAALEGHKQVATEFITRDPCVLYLKDNKGKLPYQSAAESGHRGLSEYLRSSMENDVHNCTNYTYSESDLEGNSPIHWAALEGNLDSIKMILSQYGWYVDAQKINGDTPLHLASKEGHIEIIEELISSGAKVDVKNTEGETPLHLASTNGKLLAVMELLENNAPVDSKDRNGDTPLHHAAWEGHLAVLEELIERNASVNIQNKHGNTPLNWAAWAGRVEIIQLLLKHGADIELKNFEEGFNALHRAAEQGQMAAAKVLLSKNPSLIGIKDNRNRTPYDVAKDNKHEDLAEYFKSLMYNAQ